MTPKHETQRGAGKMSGKSVKNHEAAYWHVRKFGLLPVAGLFVFLLWLNSLGRFDFVFLAFEFVFVISCFLIIRLGLHLLVFGDMRI